MKRTGRAVATAIGTSLFWCSFSANAGEASINNFKFTYNIEVAGADASDVATDKELKTSGTKMVPANPTAASRNPLKPETVKEVKAVTPKPVPKAAPEPTPASEPVTAKSASEQPATAAKEAAPAPDAPSKPMKLAEKPGADLFKPYLRIDGGFAITNDPTGSGATGTHMTDEIQNTGIFDIGIGALVDKQVRLEGMLTYRSPMQIDGKNGASNTISGEVGSISAMVNLYYDIEEAHAWMGTDAITPYVGVGAGISMLDTDSLSTAGGTSERGVQVYNLTYAAMAGLTSKISDMISLDAGYRFINLGQFEQDGTFSNGTTGTATKYDDLFAHEVRAGLRFQF